jgi:hypothetical protein
MIERLRRMYPKAKGEKGCAHRLFFVSLMVAHKTFSASRTNSSSLFPFNADWHSYSNAFSKEELKRMEFEFISFLKFDLFVSLNDFWYFLDTIQGLPQRVPQFDSLPEWICHSSSIDSDFTVPI